MRLLLLVLVFSRSLAHAADPIITVSPETTNITEPLDEDGYVDYARALDQLASKGVTPDNNAAKDLLVLVRHDESMDDQTYARLAKALGALVVTDDTPVFHFLSAEEEKLAAQLDAAVERPWKSGEFAELSKWIDENQAALDVLVEASGKTKFYYPLSGKTVVETEWGEMDLRAFAISLPLHNPLRLMNRALLARSNRSLEQRQFEACWSDLNAVFRWSRLMGQTPAVIPYLMSAAVLCPACQCTRRLVLDPECPPKLADRIANDLQTLPKQVSLADIYRTGERWGYLDALLCVALNGFNALKVLNDFSSNDTPARGAPIELAYVSTQPGLRLRRPDWRKLLSEKGLELWWAYTDWNQVLKQGNASYADVVNVFSLPPGKERLAAAARLEVECFQRRVQGFPTSHSRRQLELMQFLDAIDGWILALAYRSPGIGFAYRWFEAPRTRAFLTRRMELTCFVLAGQCVSPIEHVRTRAETEWNLTRVTLALVRYRQKQGQYPQQLSDLTPQMLETIPIDLFTAEALMYESDGRTFLLLSVGTDGKRDSADDQKEYPEADFVVRSPADSR